MLVQAPSFHDRSWIMTISLVFGLISVAAAIVAFVLAKHTQLEARKAAEDAALMSQRLDDLYRAVRDAQVPKV